MDYVLELEWNIRQSWLILEFAVNDKLETYGEFFMVT